MDNNEIVMCTENNAELENKKLSEGLKIEDTAENPEKNVKAPEDTKTENPEGNAKAPKEATIENTTENAKAEEVQAKNTDEHSEDNTVSEFQEEEPVLQALKLPDPVWEYRNGIGVFAFSQRGQSHIERDNPCQDRCGFKFVEDKNILIAAIADGVGSCALSDYGSECAVNASIECIYEALKKESADFKLSNAYMGSLLRTTMNYAYDAVEKRADEIDQMLYSLQSTLTVAVYDGKDLYFAHAGDDGIVVLNDKGIYAMSSTRHKGEEASSVYPLQSKNTWQFGKTENVVAFVMATDGVLDSFVMKESEKNRVYYPFVKQIFDASNINSSDDIKVICDDFYGYMNSEQYRKVVRDDLTLVGVINTFERKKSISPEFNKENWERESKEYYERRKKALYPTENQKTESPSNKFQPSTPQSNNPQNTEKTANYQQSINRQQGDSTAANPNQNKGCYTASQQNGGSYSSGYYQNSRYNNPNTYKPPENTNVINPNTYKTPENTNVINPKRYINIKVEILGSDVKEEFNSFKDGLIDKTVQILQSKKSDHN